MAIGLIMLLGETSLSLKANFEFLPNHKSNKSIEESTRLSLVSNVSSLQRLQLTEGVGTFGECGDEGLVHNRLTPYLFRCH
jgi:hypothetical protein